MSIKKGDKVQCDFGWLTAEIWKNCTVLEVIETQALFTDNKHIALHVKATDGDTMLADYWTEGWYNGN